MRQLTEFEATILEKTFHRLLKKEKSMTPLINNVFAVVVPDDAHSFSFDEDGQLIYRAFFAGHSNVGRLVRIPQATGQYFSQLRIAVRSKRRVWLSILVMDIAIMKK